MEALGSYAFPTQVIEIGNYLGDFFESKGRADIAEQYHLDRFPMKLQALERTYIDKVFALCDYYLQRKSKRYSRHLYDLYKLNPQMVFDEEFRKLIKEIRAHREKLPMCPSAQLGVDVEAILTRFCDEDFYKTDYQAITSYFAADYVTYENVVENIRNIVKSGMFKE